VETGCTTTNIEGVMTVTAAPLTAPHRHHSALTIGIAVVMMELAYLPNVVLCVLVATSWGALQIGAYAVLLTSAAYGVHVLAVLSGRMAPPSQ
jgi:hypothetical protein